MAGYGPFYKVEVETAETLFRLLVREDDLVAIEQSLNRNGPVGFWRFAGLRLTDQRPIIFFIPLDQIQTVTCTYYVAGEDQA